MQSQGVHFIHSPRKDTDFIFEDVKVVWLEARPPSAGAQFGQYTLRHRHSLASNLLDIEEGRFDVLHFPSMRIQEASVQRHLRLQPRDRTCPYLTGRRL